MKVSRQKFNQVQYHNGYIYVSADDCNCIKRIDSKNHNDIKRFTKKIENRTIRSFKINFNDDLFAILDDDHFYKWNYKREKWMVFYEGPFLHFDALNQIVLVNKNTNK